MRTARRGLQLLFAVLVASCAFSVQAAQVLIPAYFYPIPGNTLWQQLNDAATMFPVTAIVNPDSGPGLTFDATYAAAIADFRAAGGIAIGYVPTNYAQRDVAAVQADIRQFLDWYPVDGIFLDEVSNQAGDLPYYALVHDYAVAQQSSLSLIGNPGLPAPESFLGVFDTIVMFENYADQYPNYVPPAFQANYDASQFAMLAHEADESTMTTLVAQAAADNFGYIFITDRTFASNPWAGTPGYWESELTQLQAVTPVPLPAGVWLLVSGVGMLTLRVRQYAQCCR